MDNSVNGRELEPTSLGSALRGSVDFAGQVVRPCQILFPMKAKVREAVSLVGLHPRNARSNSSTITLIKTHKKNIDGDRGLRFSGSAETASKNCVTSHWVNAG